MDSGFWMWNFGCSRRGGSAGTAGLLMMDDEEKASEGWRMAAFSTVGGVNAERMPRPSSI
jgi:hypothetical protein